VFAIDGRRRNQGFYSGGVQRRENEVKEVKGIKEVKEKTRLFAEMSKEPEEERKANAEEEAGDDGEIKSGVLAAVDDVAGKAAEAKRELAAEIKKSADEDEEAAEEKKGAAEFAERVHGEHCNGRGGRKGHRGI